MTKRYWVILTLSILMVFGGGLYHKAYAQGNNGKLAYMVTSFINNSQLIQGHSISYDIHVAKINASKPKETIKDANDASVYVYFKQGEKVVKNILTSGDKGLYHGEVTLNQTGQWQVMIIATNGAPAESITSEGPETLHTTWNIEAPTMLYYWYWMMGLLALAVVIIFILIRRKKS